MDAVGSMFAKNSFFKKSCVAGGKVMCYCPLRLRKMKRNNHCVHRELLVIDRIIAFIRSAGIDSKWLPEREGKPGWRDTLIRLIGPIAFSLQFAFNKSWGIFNQH